MIRTDRVSSLIIIIQILPVEEQLMRLNVAEKNRYIEEEEILYIKKCLNIADLGKNIEEKDEVEPEITSPKRKNRFARLEDITIHSYRKGVEETVTTQDNNSPLEIRNTGESEIKETESFIEKFEKLEHTLSKIELTETLHGLNIKEQLQIIEKKYTLEQAEKVKTYLINMRTNIMELCRNNVKEFQEQNSEIRSRYTAAINLLEEQVKIFDWYILEKKPNMEKKEAQELTTWEKIKKFFGNIGKKTIINETILSDMNSRKEKREKEKLRKKTNNIIENHTRDIERWAKDTFLWRNGFSDEEKIDKIYNELRGSGQSYLFFTENEEENRYIAKRVFIEVKKRHREWKANPRNPINMGQCVNVLECDNRKPEGR